jgi:hypothetical protein
LWYKYDTEKEIDNKWRLVYRLRWVGFSTLKKGIKQGRIAQNTSFGLSTKKPSYDTSILYD